MRRFTPASGLVHHRLVYRRVTLLRDVRSLGSSASEQSLSAVSADGAGGKGWSSPSTSATLMAGPMANPPQLPKVSSRADWRAIEKHLEAFEASVKDRRIDGGEAAFERALNASKRHRQLVKELNDAHTERKALSTQQGNLIIAKAKANDGGEKSPVSEDIAEQGRQLKERVTTLSAAVDAALEELDTIGLNLPNWIDSDAPREGQVVLKSGEYLDNNGEGVVIAHSTLPPREFHFSAKDHVSLGESLDIVDFRSPVTTSGPKFATLKNDGALLELALAQWALSKLMAAGFQAMLTPELVHTSVLEGCGFQPRGNSNHVYKVGNEGEGHRDLDLCLVGTSEVALAGSQAGRRFKGNELPLRLAGFGHCFRAEAGSGGVQGRGLFRLHQFSKAEMFVFCAPWDAAEEHAKLRKIQENICDELGLRWRTIDMFPHELGHPAARKFDIQAFMPSRHGYGEVASISSCSDYQSRRLDIRFAASPPASGDAGNIALDTKVKNAKGKKGTEMRGFVHTLNGTAIAIPRIILSILETHQQADGSVRLPDCIVPFMGGKQFLVPKT